MQFGKAEQDAFILDFNPTGGYCAAWRLPALRGRMHACSAPCPLSASEGSHTPASLPACLPTYPAVLTAVQAFSIVLSTFDSKFML